MHAPKLSYATFTLCTIFLHIVNGQSSSCPKSSLSHGHQKKYGFWTRHLCILYQSLVSNVASRGEQDLRRTHFRFLSQSWRDFCQVSVKNLFSVGFWNLFRKENGKTVLPACGSFPNWEYTIHVHSVIFGRECK